MRVSVEALEGRQLLATITVNTAVDSTAAGSTLSLRQAIEVSNGTIPVSSLSTQQQAQVKGAVGNTNTIDFNIPATDPGYTATTGVWTIALKSGLPAISTNAAIIDGYSQPGATENTLAQGNNAKLTIAVDGSGAGNTYGLPVAQPGSQVRGLDIENFGGNGYGILITAAGNVQVAGCFIGTDPTGKVAAPNWTGVGIENSSNVIGGPNVGDRNLISGNSNYGLYVFDQAGNPQHIEPTGNLIENNEIGTDAPGTKALGNFNYGVWDYGSGDTYGGATGGLGNVISGNVTGGIRTGGSVTIEGNYLGTDVTGNVALGGGDIFAEQDLSGPPVLSTVITNNVASGNAGWGIYVAGSSQPSQATYMIANNLIGTNAAGTAALGNGLEGLFVSADNASILDNVISGNAGVGIRLSGCKSAVVQGNLIGTDKTGQVALGNTAGGIVLSNSTGTMIGGSGAGQGNVVDDNGGIGIEVDEGQQNQITHNSIFGNTGPGIYLNPFVTQVVPAPVLTFTPGAGSTGTLSGTLKASPGVAYTIEIYSNPSALAPGQEQGKTFVQDVTVNTDGSGKATFSVTEPIGFYAATAIDPSGNTSPFSNAVGSQALAASQTAVSSSSNPSTAGQPVTFTAVVTAPGYHGTPTGTVTFSIDGHAQSPVQLSVVGGMDEAQFTTSTLAAGSHTVSASYRSEA
jgi:parallel beta-helix repeat protein